MVGAVAPPTPRRGHDPRTANIMCDWYMSEDVEHPAADPVAVDRHGMSLPPAVAPAVRCERGPFSSQNLPKRNPVDAQVDHRAVVRSATSTAQHRASALLPARGTRCLNVCPGESESPRCRNMNFPPS